VSWFAKRTPCGQLKAGNTNGFYYLAACIRLDSDRAGIPIPFTGLMLSGVNGAFGLNYDVGTNHVVGACSIAGSARQGYHFASLGFKIAPVSGSFSVEVNAGVIIRDEVTVILKGALEVPSAHPKFYGEIVASVSINRSTQKFSGFTADIKLWAKLNPRGPNAGKFLMIPANQTDDPMVSPKATLGFNFRSNSTLRWAWWSIQTESLSCRFGPGLATAEFYLSKTTWPENVPMLLIAKGDVGVEVDLQASYPDDFTASACENGYFLEAGFGGTIQINVRAEAELRMIDWNLEYLKASFNNDENSVGLLASAWYKIPGFDCDVWSIAIPEFDIAAEFDGSGWRGGGSAKLCKYVDGDEGGELGTCYQMSTLPDGSLKLIKL